MLTNVSEGPYGASFYAVKCCCDAYDRATKIAKDRKLDRGDIRQAAIQSYIKSMPMLVGEDNIRGFIAAVGQGLLLDVFHMKQATTLVYIAQVALSSYPREVRAAGRPRKNPEPEPNLQPNPVAQPVPFQPAAQPQPAPLQLEPSAPASSQQPESAAEPQPAGTPSAPRPNEPIDNSEEGTIPSIHACVANTPQQSKGRSVNQKINTPPTPSQGPLNGIRRLRQESPVPHPCAFFLAQGWATTNLRAPQQELPQPYQLRHSLRLQLTRK